MNPISSPQLAAVLRPAFVKRAARAVQNARQACLRRAHLGSLGRAGTTSPGVFLRREASTQGLLPSRASRASRAPQGLPPFPRSARDCYPNPTPLPHGLAWHWHGAHLDARGRIDVRMSMSTLFVMNAIAQLVLDAVVQRCCDSAMLYEAHTTCIPFSVIRQLEFHLGRWWCHFQSVGRLYRSMVIYPCICLSLTVVRT